MQVAEGLSVLHQRQPPVAHGSIKHVRTHIITSRFWVLIYPKENIIVDNDQEVVLSEVGLAEFFETLGSVRYGKAADVRHLAPEFLETGKHTVESDMYSFGCLGMGEWYQWY